MYIFDLDDLKKINDTYGHAMGDKMLQMFAGVLKSHTRDGDILSRYGGDEFMMLDYGTELLEPVRVMERLHFLIAKKCEEKKIREQVLYSWGIPWGEDLVSFYHNLHYGLFLIKACPVA